MVIALVPLAWLVIAGATMMLLWALRVLWVKPLMVIFGGLPFIGAQAAQAIGSLAGSLADFVSALVNAELQAATDFLDFVSGNATMAVRWATGAANWVGITLRQLVGAIFAQVLALSGQVAGLLPRVAAIAGQVAGLLVHVAAIAAQVGRLVSTVIPAAVAAGVSLAVARATALVTALRLALTAAIASALATALHAVGAEAAARAASDLAVRSFAAAQVAAATAVAAANLAHLSVVVGAEISELGRVIGGVDARIGAIAAPTVAIAIETIATEISTMRRTCVDPMCSFLTPQLRALELVEEVAMLAAVTELLAGAVADPQRAAREAIETSRPLVSGAAAIVAELTGLQARGV